MKVTLEFDEESREEAEHSLKGVEYYSMLEEIWDKMLRPNNKHGYCNKILDSEEAYEVIEELIKIYLEIRYQE